MKDRYTWIRARSEWAWARNYIERKADTSSRICMSAPLRALPGQADDEAWVRAAVDALQKDGRDLLVRRLKNTLRQHRLRNTNPDRKQRSFTLPDDASKALVKLARKYGKSQVGIIIDLITESSSILERVEQKHKEELDGVRGKLAHERLQHKQKAVNQEEQIKELKKTLLIQVRLLEMWEQSMGESRPPYDGDAQRIEVESKKRFEALIKESDRHAKVGALLLLRPSLE